MNIYKIIEIIITILLIIFICAAVSGCHIFQKKDNNIPIINEPEDMIYRTIYKTNWLATAAILGCGASFFAFLNGHNKGLQLMAACFLVLSMVLMISRYAVWIAACCLVGSLALMVYTVLVRNRALKQTVLSVQRSKKLTWEGFKDMANSIQDKATKKLVSNIKTKDKLNG